eukprot:c14105_g2_i1 orf=131-400(-)
MLCIILLSFKTLNQVCNSNTKIRVRCLLMPSTLDAHEYQHLHSMNMPDNTCSPKGCCVYLSFKALNQLHKGNTKIRVHFLLMHSSLDAH